jgi:hypothetical protein
LSQNFFPFHSFLLHHTISLLACHLTFSGAGQTLERQKENLQRQLLVSVWRQQIFFPDFPS